MVIDAGLFLSFIMEFKTAPAPAPAPADGDDDEKEMRSKTSLVDRLVWTKKKKEKEEIAFALCSLSVVRSSVAFARKQFCVSPLKTVVLHWL